MPTSQIRTRLATFLLLLLLVAPVGAQDSNRIGESPDFPTVTALEHADLPERDRTDLGRRIDGVTDIPPRPTSAPVRQVGNRENFWGSNDDIDESFEIPAVLRVVGEHVYLWVEEGAPVSDADLEYVARGFDETIYPGVRALWGSEDSPGVDGDPRVHILFAYGLGSTTAAYFAGDHTYPQAVVPTSNEREMFFVNMSTMGTNIGYEDMLSVIAHEFQHMIRAHVDANEDSWLDEGFSTFTERYLGYFTSLWMPFTFQEAPYYQLNTWTEDGDRSADYGAAMMFTTYFYERYGIEATQRLSAEPANGLISVDVVLAEMGEPGVNDFYADWVLANWLLDRSIDDGRYGYTLMPPTLPRPMTRENIIAYPQRIAGQSNQYATDYYTLQNVRGGQSLDITFRMPDIVQLIPTRANSGSWMWYSNRGDNSDTRVTRAFDLSGVSSATLNYSVWYHIENLWDYAYLMVSTDGGATWTILETPYTTYDDPYFKSYGAGYTGRSGGWLQESISLDAYVGGEVLVRFEMITDDAVNQPGIAIDDLSIPEIGYSSDFENGTDGWEAEGWVLIDNRLPQQAWVQVVQMSGGNFVGMERFLAPTDDTWTVTLDSRTDNMMVAVSPFAPVTTVATPYTIEFSMR